jgi:hypothetical protein
MTKKFLMYRDSHRVCADLSDHACNECGGWELRGTRVDPCPILHEVTCSFYPGPANLELEDRLKKQGFWKGSKWDNETGRLAREKATRHPSLSEAWRERFLKLVGKE